MAVEIEYVPKRTETVTELASSPESVTGDVVESTEVSDDRGRTAYEVTHEITVTEEQYVVHTQDGMGKEKRTYWIKQNDSGEWEVTKVRKSPNRGHPTQTKRNAESTPAVRDALKEERGIELVN